jgi:hypothetical protein
MRKTTKIIVAAGGGFSGVGGILLAIYLDDAKTFLDDLLSRIFGIPKSMVGYDVVTVVITGFLAYATLSMTFFLTIGILDWHYRGKHHTQAPVVSHDPARKESIWRAIKKWVELPINRFRDKQDTLPLAEKPPELAVEIEECLSRYYPSIWQNVTKLRQEYHEWKDTDSTSKFTKVVEGQTIINLTYAQAYDEEKKRGLVRAHNQLAEQIKSEILDKYHDRLEC